MAKSKIRVLHVISDLSIGGAEMMLFKLLATTDRDQFEPIVLTLREGGSLGLSIRAQGIPVYSANIRNRLPSLFSFGRLVRLLRSIQPDLIHAWMYHSCLAALIANFLVNKSAITLWSIHDGTYSPALLKRLTRIIVKICAPLSRLVDQIVFVSHASQQLHLKLGYSLQRSCVIPNGVNTSEFVPSVSARNALRTELGLTNNAVLIGMLGRYDAAKDHLNFLRAASELLKNSPDTHFVIAGKRVSFQNQGLCRSIRELGLSSRVHLLGERYDMPRITASLDILSLSSVSESFPNVVAEAMSCKVPCVVTDVGDAALIVGDTGRVVPTKDPGALANAWQTLIDAGAKGRGALGTAARARVTENFELNSVTRRYEKLYTSLVAAKLARDATRTAGEVSNLTFGASFDDSGAQ
jgi:glycosyltransferase involved in cell wall biosynthesis